MMKFQNNYALWRVAGLVDAAPWKLPSMATEFIVVKETVVLPANSGQLFMGHQI